MLKVTLRDGETFEGRTCLDLVRAMKGATMFSDVRTIPEYLDMVLRNAKDFEDIELRIRGCTDEGKAESLVSELQRMGLARVERSVRPKAKVPAKVLAGLEAVRRSGNTNMLDHIRVAELARYMGFPDTAQWVRKNTKLYAEGIFRGFEASDKGGE